MADFGSGQNHSGNAVVYPMETLAASVVIHRLLSAGWSVVGIKRMQMSENECPASRFFRLEGTPTAQLRTLQRTEYYEIKQALLRANAVIYFSVGSIQDVTNALRLLSQVPYEVPKNFILVSNALTWSETISLRREATPLENKNDDLKAEADGEPLTEDQFHRRVPHAKYLAWKEVEKLCRSLNRADLQTYVVVSGLTYGCGEDILLPLFRIAWTQDAQGLPLFGCGTQRIPMIHTFDLSTVIIRIVYFRNESDHLEQRYIFAVDEGKETYQTILRSLGNCLGTLRTYKVPDRDLMLIEGIEHFTLDVNMEQGCITTLLVDEGEEEVETSEGSEESSQQQKKNTVSFTWHMRTGFTENIESICNEFRHYQGVAPLRLILIGPPGKHTLEVGDELASWYKLPCWTLKSIISTFLQQQSALQEEAEQKKAQKIAIRRNLKLTEKKELKIREWREEHAQKLQQKRRSSGADENDDEEDGHHSAHEDHVDGTKYDVGDDGDEEEEDREDGDDDGGEDDEEEPDMDGIDLDEDEEKEIKDAFEAEDLEDIEAEFAAQMEEVTKILSMRVKPVAEPEPTTSKKGKSKDNKTSVSSEPKSAENENAGTADSTNPARFTEEAIALMTRWVLRRPHCAQQGYILIGYPWSVQQARLFLVGTPEPSDEKEHSETHVNSVPSGSSKSTEHEGTEGVRDTEPSTKAPLMNQCDRLFFPTHCIFLNASQEVLDAELQNVSEQDHPLDLKTVPLSETASSPPTTASQSIVKGSDDQGIKSPRDLFQKHLVRWETNAVLLKQWVDSVCCKEFVFSGRIPPCDRANPAGYRQQVTMRTLQHIELSIQILETNRVQKVVPSQPEQLDPETYDPNSSRYAPRTWNPSTVDLTLKIGKSRNFGPTPVEIAEENNRIRLWKEEKEMMDREKKVRKRSQEKAEQEQVAEQRRRDEEKLRASQVYEREMLEKRKEPLRQYLLDTVLPVLTKGLIELCETKPEDPVDALAEWLFRYNPIDNYT